MLKKQKRIKQSLILILLLTGLTLLFPLRSSALDRYIVVWQKGNKTVHYVETLNGQAYVQLEVIAPLMFPNSDYQESDGLLRWENKEIKITASSYALQFRQGQNLRNLQMKFPAYFYKNQLCVPFIPFLQALDTLNLCKVRIEEKTIYVSNVAVAGETEETADELEEEEAEPQVIENVQPESEPEPSTFERPILKNSFLKSAKRLIEGLKNTEELSAKAIPIPIPPTPVLIPDLKEPERVAEKVVPVPKPIPPPAPVIRPDLKEPEKVAEKVVPKPVPPPAPVIRPDLKEPEKFSEKVVPKPVPPPVPVIRPDLKEPEKVAEKVVPKPEPKLVPLPPTPELKPDLKEPVKVAETVIPVPESKYVPIPPAPVLAPDLPKPEKAKKQLVTVPKSAGKNKPASVLSKPGMAAPKDKKYPPNLYVLPKNLIIKELDEVQPNETKTKKKENQDINNNYTPKTADNTLFAANSLFSLVSLPQVTECKTVKKENCIELHFTSDNNIADFQLPEYKDGTLILRFRDAVNSITDFSGIEKTEPFTKVKTEKIRDILVYRIKLKAQPEAMTSSRNGSKEIVYNVCFKKLTEKAGSENESAKAKPKTSEQVTEPEEEQEKHKEDHTFDDTKKRWALDVIVLDPGHGGHDPGTIGVNGYKEKDYALDIALKVKELIEENMPETKVVMTRKDDTFIELFRRTQIANEKNGKLFVSIHLNATPKKPSNANGFETYILRPGRNDDAVRVANFENSVIKFEKTALKYKRLTEEEVILATLAQSAFVRFSEFFARMLQDEVSKTTPMKNRGVNQAGFYVLVGASMPNVLFEAAFMSNTDDEAFVTGKNGTKKIAQGIFNAIKKYSAEYEKVSH